MPNPQKKSKAPTLKTLSIIIAAVALLLIISEGTHNHPDQFWFELDTLLATNGIKRDTLNPLPLDIKTINKYKINYVADNFSQLDSVYRSLHSNDVNIESINTIIEKPFPLLDDYAHFYEFLNILLNKKKIVVVGVSGSGKSTLVDRLARIIAGKKENILTLSCVEKMEVEYHKEWVGYKDEKGFHIGKLLKFFEKCSSAPSEKFVFIVDDIDKIYPSTSFGSVLWNEMDNASYENYIEGYAKEIAIPPNYYLISVTHSGVGNIIEFNSEHFRRLGDIYEINPSHTVFLMSLKEKFAKGKITYNQLKRILYFFKRANDLIEKKYGLGYTLGQWSNLRKKIKPEQFNEFIEEFIVNVNAFKPQKPLSREDFEDILYAMDNEGLMPKTNMIYIIYGNLVELGIFSELSVALLFAAASAIFGWVLLVKKKKFISNLNYKIIAIADDFSNGKIDFDEAMSAIVAHKNYLKELAFKGKIKYEEFLYFSIFIDDQIKDIQETNQSFGITKDFESTFDEFIKDGILDEKEYKILTKFLEKMKPALSVEIYYSLKNKIEAIRTKSGEL